MVDQISADRLRLLVRLDDGQPHGDSLGVRLRSLSDEDMAVADDLKRSGLAEVVGGWNDVFWVRLTKRGWRMRQRTRTA
ncbi:hypothetical protein [Aureimonas leprariae]|uniref:Uncharacterized protein n=1 Tax=Plantimonas leprariae TaxID=2615207 RepID=A0A7V7PK90_9HYPH|nr:hypothetical protein [Aureimonas leprariae]KAB0676027.1 hypothetical protein F6X38_22465 [Aureimonas leprariae]